jgi:O-antigen/teichoic acid export membrane protein
MKSNDFKVSQNLLYVFILKLTGAGSKLIFTYLISSYFSPSGVGVFFIALTLVTIMSVISRLGFENVVLRFSAIYYSENRWGAINSLYKRCLLTVAIFSITLSSILFGLSEEISRHLFDNEELIPILKGMSFSVVLLSILAIQAAAFKGVGRVVESQIYEVVGINLLLTAIILILNTKLGVNGIAVSYFVSAATLVIIAFMRWPGSIIFTPKKTDLYPYKKMFYIGLPLLFSNSLSLIISWADILMLGGMSSSSEVGVYGVASRLVLLVSFGLAAMNSVLSAKFSVLFAQGNFAEVERVAKKYSRIVTLCALPLLLIFMVFPENIMRLFGNEFTVGMYALSVLCIGQFFNVATGSVSMAMVMNGDQNVLLKFLFLSVVINLFLNYLLIPSLGATGAAIATSVSFIALNVCSYMYCRLKYNVRLGIL